MKCLKIKDIAGSLQRLGRTFDGPDGELFMNWTCSGIRFKFTGTCLVAELNALFSEETERNPFDGTTCSRRNWPYAAVFLEDEEEPVKYFEVNDSSKNYLLFASDIEETHTITIRKMTENAKGKISVSKLLIDGTIEAAGKLDSRLNIEFIGDSITCGFGNLSNDKDRMFYSADENGWLSYAAIASRKLKADFSIVSYSGIAITKGLGYFTCPLCSMTEIYPYTDRLIEEELGIKASFQKWNFKQAMPDVIVVNLGTNDAAVIDMNGDISRGIQKFEEEYYQFLKMLRDENGEAPWIICSLGSMDYFLYSNIEKVVERFSREHTDQRIKCFKFGRIRWMIEGAGACGHPNAATQIRMGNEIADFITGLLNL